MKSVEIVGFGPKLGGRKITARVTAHDQHGLTATDKDNTTYRFLARDAGTESRSVGQTSGWKLAPPYARQLAKDCAVKQQAAEQAKQRQALRGGLGSTPSRRDRQ